MKLEDALAQLARETARARRRLALERALRVSFPLLAAAGAWAGLALAGAHERLPPMGQSLAALGALGLLFFLALQARKNWQAPSEDQARTRVAEDSRLDPGAFETLRDQPTRYDSAAFALWQRARERALEHVAQVRGGPLRPRLDEIDRYRLRYVLAAALVGALVIAGADAPERLARAFLPDPGPLLGDQPLVIEAWASPAEYTHAAPISLSESLGARVATPPSINVTVRLTGPSGAPRLVFRGRGKHESVKFVRAADDAWEARMEVPGAGRLSIVRFHERAFWRLAPAQDAPPTAALTAPIAKLANDHIAIGWRARDDYGIRRLVLRVRPVSPPPGLARADAIDTEVETPAGDPREAEAQTELDLVAHAYAGMEVEARLVAIDGLGQEGVSEPLRVTLPEKVFLQPLARAAIEIRRHILAERRPYRAAPREARRTVPAGDIVLGSLRLELRDYGHRPALARAPEGVRRAARLLDALSMDPGDGYFADLAVFLGLRLARSELDVADTIENTQTAARTLWAVALRAEYGGAADTRRALEEAQRQLSEALAQGAPKERIAQLTQKLREAAARYMQALVQEAIRDGDSVNTEDTQDQTEISTRDIEQMMRDVERLSEQGRNAEANAMLQSLARILQNLDVRMDQGQNQEAEPQAGDAEQSMQQRMDNLLQAMRNLSEETRQQQSEQRMGSAGGGGEQEGGQGGGELADRQSQIRQGLAEAQRLAEEAGSAPSDDLNAAGEAMREAENALRRGDIEGARNAQSIAMDDLREGAEAVAARMRESEGNSGRNALETGEGNGPPIEDPLGRDPSAGRNDDAYRGIGAANGGDASRSRAVFDDILRRAQDPNRPEAEREYLRRLLDRFGGS